MTKPADRADCAEAVYRLIREGPNSDDGTLMWFLGMIVWWRMLAQFVLLGASVMVVSWVGYWIGEPVLAAVVALVVGVNVGGWIKHLSPKYNVTKNY